MTDHWGFSVFAVGASRKAVSLPLLNKADMANAVDWTQRCEIQDWKPAWFQCVHALDSILVERWHHAEGRINDTKPRDTEIAILTSGRCRVRRIGDGDAQDHHGMPGTACSAPPAFRSATSTSSVRWMRLFTSSFRQSPFPGARWKITTSTGPPATGLLRRPAGSVHHTGRLCAAPGTAGC